MNIKLINHSKLLILGSGPAGYTASIYAARANLNPVIITGNEQGGQLMSTVNIENWPSYYNFISGSDLMLNFLNHVKKFNVKIIHDHIKKVNFLKKPFILIGNYGKYTCDSLIIATGASAKYLNISSEKKFIGKGISTCATCDGFFYKNKIIAIVGGGNTAIEEAIYLSKIVKKIFLIHRGNKFKAESILINKIIKNKKIKIFFNYEIKKIIGNEKKIKKIFLKNNINNNNMYININGLFIAIGNNPNTNIFKNQLCLDNKGYIKINSGLNGNITATNIKGIFAAGDVQDSIYKQAITSSAFGCMAALDVQNYFNNKK